MNFNEKLIETNVIVMSAHPDAIFYEAQGILNVTDNEDIQPTVSEMTIIYALPIAGMSVIGHLEVIVKGDEEPVMEVIDQPWLEDRPMTPYVSATLEDAFERVKMANYDMKSQLVVLRHPLVPGVEEPKYIFGDNKTGFVGVNVIDAKVEIVK